MKTPPKVLRNLFPPSILPPPPLPGDTPGTTTRQIICAGGFDFRTVSSESRLVKPDDPPRSSAKTTPNRQTRNKKEQTVKTLIRRLSGNASGCDAVTCTEQGSRRRVMCFENQQELTNRGTTEEKKLCQWGLNSTAQSRGGPSMSDQNRGSRHTSLAPSTIV